MRTARLSVSPEDPARDALGGPDPGPPSRPGPPASAAGQAGCTDEAAVAAQPATTATRTTTPTGPRSYLDQSLGQFLGTLSAGHAAPGGGSAAALTVALGASLCAMAARLSARQLAGLDIEFLVAEAERLRGSAASLVQADAESYRGVVAALRDQPGQDPGAPRHLMDPDFGQQRSRIDAALSEAATIPMEVVEVAAQTARLAARLAADGNPRLRGDAITAALLAEAGARSAAVLVSINLAAWPGDQRPARAQALLGEIGRAVRAATG